MPTTALPDLVHSSGSAESQPPGWPADWPVPTDLSESDAVAMLEPGNRLTQPVFHAAYSRTPAGFSAELIQGVVHVASPLSLLHASPHLKFGQILGIYEDETPGVHAADNASTVLTNIGEVQPDLLMRVRRDHGGQTTTFSTIGGSVVRSDDDGDYVSGGPEFVLEISRASFTVDTGDKRHDYLAGGVREYLVADARRRTLLWYDLASGADTPTPLPDDGILRSRTMPGLWLNVPALFRRQGREARKTLEEGLATPEHAAFVEQLAAANRAYRESHA